MLTFPKYFDICRYSAVNSGPLSTRLAQVDERTLTAGIGYSHCFLLSVDFCDMTIYVADGRSFYVFFKTQLTTCKRTKAGFSQEQYFNRSIRRLDLPDRRDPGPLVELVRRLGYGLSPLLVPSREAPAEIWLNMVSI